MEDDPFFTMTGDSAAAYRYLMGQAPASAPRVAPPQPPLMSGMRTFDFTGVPENTGGYSMANPPPAGLVAAATGLAVPGLPRYQRDPVTGQLIRMPDPGTGLPAALVPASQWGGGDMSGGAGGYRSGGALLEGPGDGVSDSISGTIDGDRPVRVATGEFIFDARTVSEIGNGDTKAGAKKLYAVMDAIHQRRKSAKRGEPSGADGELRKLLA